MLLKRKKQTFDHLLDFNQGPHLDGLKIMETNRPESNPKTTFVTISVCLFVAIMAIYDENNSHQNIKKPPFLLKKMPNSFDSRITSDKNYNFAFKEESSIIQGFNFAKTISEILSSYFSLQYQASVSLSVQQLLDCTVVSLSNQDICHHTTQKNIDDVLVYINQRGLTTNYCYPFRSLGTPNACSRLCLSDKSTIQGRLKAQVSSIVSDVAQVKDWVTKNKPVIIVKQSDNINKRKVVRNYSLGILQMVGWKEAGDIFVCSCRLGSKDSKEPILILIVICNKDKSIKGESGFSYWQIMKSQKPPILKTNSFWLDF